MLPHSSLPTQRDIAEAAGVARSTVTRALRNDVSIPQASRERIQRIARELGYRPDPLIAANMARVRSGGNSRTKAVIGYLCHHPLSFYTQLGMISQQLYFESAKARATTLGYEVDVIHLDGELLNSRHRLTSILLARGIQGVLIAPFDNPVVRLQLDWQKFASASIGFNMVQPRICYSSSAHYRVVRLALRHLVRLGYRRIGLALPPRADRYADGALSAAYCLYADTRRAEHRVPRFRPRGGLGGWNWQNFMRWFDEHRPEAIIGMSAEPYEWLAASGLKVPQDVGFVHLNCYRDRGHWSGIDEHNELVGAAALQMVADQLMCNERGVPVQPRCVLIDGEWVAGQTVRKVGGAERRDQAIVAGR